MAKRIQARTEGGRVFALHDGDRDGRLLSGFWRQGREAHHHARTGRRWHEVYRGRFRRLSEVPVQPQVATRDRRRRIHDEGLKPWLTSARASPLGSGARWRAERPGARVPRGWPGLQFPAASSAAISSRESLIATALMISSSCLRLVALAIGAVMMAWRSARQSRPEREGRCGA